MIRSHPPPRAGPRSAPGSVPHNEARRRGMQKLRLRRLLLGRRLLFTLRYFESRNSHAGNIDDLSPGPINYIFVLLLVLKRLAKQLGCARDVNKLTLTSTRNDLF